MKGIRANGLDSKTCDALIAAAVDITAPVAVNVVVNEMTRVVHVNINGVCVLRACQISDLTLEHTVDHLLRAVKRSKGTRP